MIRKLIMLILWALGVQVAVYGGLGDGPEAVEVALGNPL